MENEQNQEAQNQKPTSESQVSSPQLQELIAAVENLKQQNQALQSQVSQTQAKQAEEEPDEPTVSEKGLKELLGMETPTQKISKKGIDELSNEELVEAMASAVEQLVSDTKTNATKEVQSTVQGINKKIEAIQNVVMNLAVQSDIATCRNKYPDFNNYTKDIQAELTATPGLSIEKAYLLVKASKASSTPAKRVTETEKPSNALTEALEQGEEEEAPPVRPNRTVKQPTSANSVVSFREALNAAVDRVVTAREKGRQ